MIDKPTAQKAVLEYLNTHYKVPNDELIIVDSLDKEYGWIFFYDSRQYLESHDMQYAIAGNAPVAVARAFRRQNLDFAGLVLPAFDFEKY